MKIESWQNTFWITMENIPELTYKLGLMLMENGVTIQKYYWRSLFDETYLELQEPLIYDAFQFHLDVTGDSKIINNVLEEFLKIQNTYRHLDKCLRVLTKQEIKELAEIALQNMKLFV